MATPTPPRPTRDAFTFTPMLVTSLREGYGVRRFAGDAAAGLTVAIIALPLAMGLGIASIPLEVAQQLAAKSPLLSPPAIGLYTAIVAGLVISALGGSRVQIGGPTAAFIPIVYQIAQQHGYEGLALATLMAGVIVILLGVFKLGRLISFIPYPVTTGFTAGIAVTIALSQIKDFLGLSITNDAGQPIGLPADFLPKVAALSNAITSAQLETILVGAGSLAVLITLRRVMPRIPGAIVAVVLASFAVQIFGLDKSGGGVVETVGSRFSELPRMLPAPQVPGASSGSLLPSPKLIIDLIPAATTIALLCAIESLLSAVVADGMTGGRHRPDQELVGQGAANIASSLFFGLPATGAIARTVANIKAGASSPVAGVLHAVILLIFMLALAPLAKMIPLATLAAVLLMVAWNISEVDHFRALMRAPREDILVLLTTFGLTVFADLTVGVGVGMILASLLFMKRMAEVAHIGAITGESNGTLTAMDPGSTAGHTIPKGVEVYEIDGPFFFGVADRLKDTLTSLERPPRVFILRLRKVPHMDASGLHALEEFHTKCTREGITLLLGGVHAQPMMLFARSRFDERLGSHNMFETLDEALARAAQIVAEDTKA